MSVEPASLRYDHIIGDHNLREGRRPYPPPLAPRGAKATAPQLVYQLYEFTGEKIKVVEDK